MFGYSRRELLHARVEDLVPERFRVKSRSELPTVPRRRLLGEGPELFGLRKDGTEFPVEVNVSLLQTEGGELVSNSIRDISDRKSKEAELEASRHQVAVSEKLASLGTMVSGFGHEVRTPLTYINTNLDLIKIQIDKVARGEMDPTDASETIAKLVLKSKDGVQRADKIVQQLRQFAKAQLKTEPADLLEVVTNTVELFRSVHNGQLVVKADLRPVNTFEMDKGQIQQVLINLLNNAAEAMGNAGILEVRLGETPGGAEIEVKDTGPGIPKEVQPRIFDPFFTTKAEGTGLGLPISRRIIEAHGGTIGFTTSPNGTTFKVTLPRKGYGSKEMKQ